ncbi:guanine deaminase [Paenibacillus swuensis]|uniref:Guanine deaminase n=1 Tax=Paenibacillus swuensis TaxID=1178515 RepID=A0A172TI37_9BACL|nr:nucleoside deaminase [Paenibacillus swuensis]ANE46626.1 guanine deaminase [Paenibacillus swuensis]
MYNPDMLLEAIKLAAENVRTGHGGPFGCVVVHDGVIIGRGFNEVTSSNDPTAHAEVQAIREACSVLGTYQLTECEIYTSCEPCPMCLGAIYWARPQAVYYYNTRHEAADIGFDDQFIYDQLEVPIEERKIPFQHTVTEVPEENQPFRLWSISSKRVEY